MPSNKHKQRVHYTAQYLINPTHRVTVDLVGLGGTGSQVLTMLGRMNSALTNLGHPGLHVRCWDPDAVEQPNVGRQAFSMSDIGVNKAVCIVGRVNRFFGTDWEAVPMAYSAATMEDTVTNRPSSNILITCTDTIRSRREIAKHLMPAKSRLGETARRHYWLDFGNAQTTGQVILGTCGSIEQPAKVPTGVQAVETLPNVMEEFPWLARRKDKDSGPSCSLAEALGRQDLFINSTLCNLGMTILWKLFRECRVMYRGAYLNLDTMAVNAIVV